MIRFPESSKPSWDKQDGLVDKAQDYYRSLKNGTLLSNLLFDKKTNHKPYKGTNKQIERYYSMISRWEDPTVMGFQLRINPTDPLWNLDDKDKPSAYWYLDSINQTDRANKLKRFITNFRNLIDYRNHYIQKMDGLSDLYKQDLSASYIERIVTISTIESIDLYISGMIDDYNRATYDYDNMVEVVPINLLQFDLIIVITEIRRFRTFIDTLWNDTVIKSSNENGWDESNGSVDNDGMIDLNRHLGVYCLRFDNSTLDFTTGNSWTNNLDNVSPQPISNKFKIILGRLRFHLTDLNLFSDSDNKKIYQDDLYPHYYHYEKSDYSSGKDGVRRFSKDPDKKKTFMSKVGDVVMQEVKSTAKAVTDQIGQNIGNSVSRIEGSILSGANAIISKYRPSSFAGRIINDVSKSIITDTTNSVIESISNATGVVMKGGERVEKFVSRAIINNDSKTVINDNSQKPLKGQYNNTNNADKDVHKDVLKMILYGTTPEQHIVDTINNINSIQ